jgi:hypothetical protein
MSGWVAPHGTLVPYAVGRDGVVYSEAGYEALNGSRPLDGAVRIAGRAEFHEPEGVADRRSRLGDHHQRTEAFDAALADLGWTRIDGDLDPVWRDPFEEEEAP